MSSQSSYISNRMTDVVDPSSLVPHVNDNDYLRDHSTRQSFSSYSPKLKHRSLPKRESISLINQDGSSSFLSSPVKWSSELATSGNTDLSLTHRITQPSSHSPSFQPNRPFSVSTDHLSPPSPSPSLGKGINCTLMFVDVSSTTLHSEMNQGNPAQLNETTPSIPVLQVGDS